MAHYWPTQPAPGPLGPSYDTVEPCIDLILLRIWGDGMQDGVPEIVTRFRGLMMLMLWDGPGFLDHVS